jgi:acetyl-CoA acetyltransferase
VPLPKSTQVAVVGIGLSRFNRDGSRSALAHAAEAFSAALADAGITKDAVDGLITHLGSSMGGIDYDRLAEALGLRLRWAHQTWTHGRFITSSIQSGTGAVALGLADVVACIVGISFTSLPMLGGISDEEGFRQGGGSHGETPHYGMTAPGGGAAMAARVYFERYGGGPEELAAIPIAFRRHARRNPCALMTAEMRLDDYLEQPYIVEPLRRPDFSLVSDGGACVLLASAERARGLRQPPVLIGGMQGIRAGTGEFIFATPGLGVWQQEVGDPRLEDHRVYAMAGVSSAQVDSLHTYDAFSPNVLFTLERFGFCGRGEALDFVQNGRIELGGELPMNTAGGLLSEAHVGGMNHIVEIVRQLRGQAGERQVPNCEVIQWATPWSDSVIFHRA